MCGDFIVFVSYFQNFDFSRNYNWEFQCDIYTDLRFLVSCWSSWFSLLTSCQFRLRAKVMVRFIAQSDCCGGAFTCLSTVSLAEATIYHVITELGSTQSH